MKRILFQGDSITDCGRNRNDFFDLGNGYAKVVAGKLGLDNIGKYEFLNRGNGGNRIVDVYARIKADIINLKPDYMSILIGVNDVWHEIGSKNGVEPEKFYKIYDMLISEIKEALPQIKILIMLPFVLEGPATCNVEERPSRLDEFVNGVAKRREKAIEIAKKYNLAYTDLQSEFDKGVALSKDASYWTRDGVHPNQNGHELISRAWITAFDKMK